jgi:enterochelin esterase-like enzyme
MKLQEFTLRSPDRRYERAAWFRPGPRAPHRLCVLLDGEFYLERAEALPLLEALTAAGRIAAMSWLFVASGGAEARHADFTYSPPFARFIAEDAVGWARAQVGSIAAEGHLVCGLSLSGLAAAHLTLLHRDRFSAALCQSGSFWHRPEQLAGLVEERPPEGARFWLSVGDQETEVDVRHPPTGLLQPISQIDGVKRACEVLRRSGAAVHFHRYAGGHDFDPWRAEFGDALEWLRVQP